MSSSVADHIEAWLDGSSAPRPDPNRLEWPLTVSGEHKKISDINTTGIILARTSLPGTAFIGPDKYTRMFRIEYQRFGPLLPRMTLHNGPDKSALIWATYAAVTLRKAWIEIPCQCNGSTEHGRVEVERKCDGKKNNYAFGMTLNGASEKFAWRRSKRPMIKDLGLSQNGYKLVRVTKGVVPSSSSPTEHRTSDRMQVVAVAGRSHFELPRCLALRFLDSFGDEWELVSLVTLLAFWLWDRKRTMKG
ncbi:hypothetical protein F5Y03DRAFT_383868 [Xylaria venustula]|nr:hypothetical protein F5Y03DRAFT_383868 [Xylaria venustula]